MSTVQNTLTRKKLDELVRTHAVVGVPVHRGRADIVYEGPVQRENGDFFVVDPRHGKRYIAPGVLYRTRGQRRN